MLWLVGRVSGYSQHFLGFSSNCLIDFHTEHGNIYLELVLRELINSLRHSTSLVTAGRRLQPPSRLVSGSLCVTWPTSFPYPLQYVFILWFVGCVWGLSRRFLRVLINLSHRFSHLAWEHSAGAHFARSASWNASTLLHLTPAPLTIT